MTDIAALGFSVDSTQIVRGTKALDGLAAAATKTEAAADKAKSGLTEMAAAADKTEGATKKTKRELDSLATSASKTESATRATGTAMVVYAGATEKAAASTGRAAKSMDGLAASATKTASASASAKAGIGGVGESAAKTEAAAKKAARELATLTQQLSAVRDRADPAGRATRQLAADTATLNAALQRGLITQQQYAQSLRGLQVQAAAADKSIFSMANALRATAGAAAATQVIRMADAYTNLTSKIRNVTDSESDLLRVRTAVFDIAARTRQDLMATGELYTRLTRATQNLGLAEQERLRITETINKAFVVSGATAQEASAAITQLAQGLASGTLRGDEFNSVAEQAPIIMDMLTKSLGKTRGQLRAMAEEGELTASVLVTALGEGAADVDRQFANMQVTVGGAFTVLKNSVTVLAAEMSGGGLTGALIDLIDMLTDVTDILSAGATAWNNYRDSVVEAGRGVIESVGGSSSTFDVFAASVQRAISMAIPGPATIDALADSIRGANSEAAEAPGIFERMGDSMREAFAFVRSIPDLAKATNEHIAKLNQERETLGMSAAQLVIYKNEKIAAAAATEAEGAAIMTAARALAADIQARDDATKAERDRATATAEAARAKAKADREAAKEQREFNKQNREYLKWWKEAQGVIDEIAKEQEQLATRYAESTAALEGEIAVLGVSGQAREGMIIQLQAEQMAREGNNGSIEEATEQYKKLLTQAREAGKLENIIGEFETRGLDDLIEKIEVMGEALRTATDPETIARLTDSIGNAKQGMVEFAASAIGAGISSLQSMASEGSKAFKALAVAQAAANVAAAIGAILNQGKGDPYTAFARMAAMAAAVGALVGSIGAFGGGPSTVRQDRQDSQGRGSVLGDAQAQSESIANATEITADATRELVGINRGMLNALNAMQAGIGAASGSLSRTGFADLSLSGANTLGLPSGSILGRLAGSIFGGDQDLVDQGLVIRGGNFGGVSRNPNASSYQTIETDGGWFGSDDIDDELEGLTGAATTQIRLILESIGDAVSEGAIALGLDAQEVARAIEAFNIEEIRISTMGLTGEEAQRELEAAFSTIFDGLAGAVVPFIDQFQRVGEGLGETLVRVATSVQVTQEAIIQLGWAFDELDPETLAQVSVGLIEAAGGIDAFIQGMQSFVDNFAPESHRFAVAQDQITRAFGQVGLSLPATREGLWDLMQSLDATTASGREQIATLLRLAGVADEYYNGLDAVAEATARAAQAQREAAESYAEFVTGFDTSGSPFQRQLAGLRSQFEENTAQANELARAAGLQAARTEDLTRIEAAYNRQREEAIRALTATVQQQIADLYGTSASKLEEAIAAIDAEVAGLDRSDSGFGMIQNLLREQALAERRAGLVTELEERRAAEEALRRQTGALDLAQNLADLALARGIGFDTLATELGLDVGRFGADLGLTAEGVNELIATLQTESLTSSVFNDGINRLIDALIGQTATWEPIPKPGMLDPGVPPPAGEKSAPVEWQAGFETVRAAVRENTAAVVSRLDRVGNNTGEMVEGQRDMTRVMAGTAMDEVRRIGRSVRTSVRPK